MDDVTKIKDKKELSNLPDSIIEKAYNLSKKDVKEARALLRKYFGVFLTNKVLKNNIEWKVRLKNHISSKNRDYDEFYEEISKRINSPETIIDLGSGSNGFSINLLKKYFPKTRYIGIEAAGQLVDQTNKFFEENNVNGKCIHEDLFNLDEILKEIKTSNKPIIIFLFQVIDALESLEKNYSKKLISELSNFSDHIIISLPTKSLGGKKPFQVSRRWLTYYLKENFKVEDDFRIGIERIIIVKKR